MRKSKLIFAFIFFTLLVAFASEKEESFISKDGPHLQRMSLRYNSKKGIGLQDIGYSTLECFAAKQSIFKGLGFLDIKGHLFDNGKWALNTGIGLRYRLLKFPIVVGMNSYYDYRRNNDHNFHQVGIGVEFLGDILRFRMNGYVPIGDKQAFRKATFSNFNHNQMILDRFSRLSMYGADAELEARACKYGFMDFFIASGPYYYQGDFGKNTFGGKARAGVEFSDTFQASIKGSYDRLFHLKVQAELKLSYHFGKRVKSKKRTHPNYLCCHRETYLMERLMDPTERQEIVVLSDQSEKKVAVDGNGDSLFFLFVNNASISGNIGTFENPFLTLAQAEINSFAGNFIYVFSGDETSSGMNSGITLKDNQSLFGATINQVVATNLGNIVIPAQGSGAKPFITNSVGVGITLANQNTVSGLRIANTTSHGIAAISPRVGSSILNNDIIDSATGGSGIFIDVLAGTIMDSNFEIKNNLITSTNGAHSGILIDLSGNGITSISVDIESNRINRNTADGMLITNAAGSGTKTLAGKIISNQFIQNSSQGINFSQAAGSIFLATTIDSNRFISNGAEAIQNNNTRGNLIISNNLIQQNGGTAGIELDINGSDQLAIEVTNNTFASNNATPGFAIDTNSTSFVSMIFSGNIATGGDTFDFSEDGTSVLEVNLGPNQGLLTGDDFTLIK